MMQGQEATQDSAVADTILGGGPGNPKIQRGFRAQYLDINLRHLCRAQLQSTFIS